MRILSKEQDIEKSYKLYKEYTNNFVTLSEYRKITGEYHKFLISKVLDGETITLPERLGTLSVKGTKQKIKIDKEGKVHGLAPDWVETKKLWDRSPEAKLKKQIVYHTNSHTDGIRYRFHWSKSRVFITNKSLFSLTMTRTNKRDIHARIMNGQQYAN